MPTAAVNGTQLWYEDAGRGPALLFVHGASADAGRWSGQVSRLRDEFRCITYDRRGSSRSPLGEGGLGPWTHADDAAALLDALGIRRCVLVATSQGGHVGLDLLLRHPGGIDGAVLNEPVVVTLDPQAAAAFAAEARAAMQAAMAAAGPRAAVDAYMALSDPAGWEATSEADRNRARDNHAGLFRSLAGPVPPIDPSDLARIAVPCLVVAGTQTRPFFRGLAELVAAGIPGARLVEIEAAGHHTYVRRPDAFAAIVRSFARSLQPTPAARVPSARGGDGA